MTDKLDINFSQIQSTDFLVNQQNVGVTTTPYFAKHIVRSTRSIRITESSQPGELVYLLPLDINLDAGTTALGKLYEHFSISNLRLIIQCTSPLGTSSGGVQAGYIPDPQNIGFATAGGTTVSNANVAKVVRQADSKFIRPRESVTFTLDPAGTRYTLITNDNRWSSFGHIAIVVRTPPEAGDTTIWEMTLIADTLFKRPTHAMAGTVTTLDTLLLKPELYDDAKIRFEIPLDDAQDEVNVHFLNPLRCLRKIDTINKIEYKRESVSNLKAVRVSDNIFEANLFTTGEVLHLIPNLKRDYLRARVCYNALHWQ